MRSVRFDLTLGFGLLALLSLFYLTLGFVVMNEHGLPAFEQDLMVRIIGHSLNAIPFGMTVFVITSFLTLFVYLIGAMDGRARAIASILRQTVTTRFSEDGLYRGVVVAFAAIFILFSYAGTKYTIKDVLTVSVFMFGLVGFMLLWLDRRLPEYARGSTVVVRGDAGRVRPLPDRRGRLLGDVEKRSRRVDARGTDDARRIDAALQEADLEPEQRGQGQAGHDRQDPGDGDDQSVAPLHARSMRGFEI